jgi:competence protein ComEC
MFIIILMICNYLIYDSVFLNANRQLTVTIIDVGQGDALLIEFPGGRKMLVDAGPSSQRYDAGERVLVPFLKRKGITHLDYMLITHPHSDHLGGGQSILNSISIDTLLLNYRVHDNNMVNKVLTAAADKKIGIRSILQGDRVHIDPNARIYVLHPDKNDLSARNRNNSSVILKVLYGEASILLAGDAEIIVEEKIIPRYGQCPESWPSWKQYGYQRRIFEKY